MLKGNLINVGIAVLGALVLSASLSATTIEPMSGEQLIDRAQIILVGECTEMRSEWFGRSLVTLFTVSVSEVIKGEAPVEVTVAVPGGFDTSGPVPIAVTFPGAPTLAPGEDLLLFLDTVEDATAFASGKSQNNVGGNFLNIVGFSQGAFPVVQEDDQAFVAQSRSSLQGALPLAVVKAQIEKHITQSTGR